MIDVKMEKVNVPADQVLYSYLKQSYDLDYTLSELLCKSDYDNMQIFILDVSCVYKSMQICMLAGKMNEFTQLAGFFANKVTEYVNVWLPQMHDYCAKNAADKVNRMN